MIRLIEKLLKNDNRTYPTLRDPNFSPRCYEMTHEERLAALKRSDDLLKKRTENQVSDYYGA
jgi:hypothetical protein